MERGSADKTLKTIHLSQKEAGESVASISESRRIRIVRLQIAEIETARRSAVAGSVPVAEGLVPEFSAELYLVTPLNDAYSIRKVPGMVGSIVRLLRGIAEFRVTLGC